MCVLLPKVSIFISLRRGVPADIKKATTNLNMLQETMVPDLQTAEGIYQILFRGWFTNFHPSVTDPLENNGVHCTNRENGFCNSFQICDIFPVLKNNGSTIFQRTLSYYINEIKRLDVWLESGFLLPGIIELKIRITKLPHKMGKIFTH